jgi:dTDP-D-glucose 4,6-dehydratase
MLLVTGGAGLMGSNFVLNWLGCLMKLCLSLHARPAASSRLAVANFNTSQTMGETFRKKSLKLMLYSYLPSSHASRC